MASSIFRQQPSGRLTSSDLIPKISSGVSQLVADDFFEYVPPTYPTSGYRSSSYASGYVGGGLTADKPTGVAAGDVLIAACIYDSQDNDITPDAGWVEILDYRIDGPDHNGFRLFGKIATSSEPSTYAFYYPVFSNNLLIITAFKDRAITEATQILANYTKDHNTSANPYPIITTAPALNATEAASLCYIVAMDATDTDLITGTAPDGFSTAVFEGSEDYASGGVFYKDNVLAGDTGPISAEINSTGSGGAGWAVVMISLPAKPLISITKRAILIDGTNWVEITDAQIGTGLKPLVLYNDQYVERSSSEGQALVIDGNRIRVIASDETLLI